MIPFPSSRLPFSVNLWIAARLLTVFSRRPLEDILRRASPANGESAYAEMTAKEIVTAAKCCVARPWRMRGRRCLRGGLLAFHFLSLAGHRPALHFGVVPQSVGTARPRAHCWVSVEGRALLNPPEEPMTELFSYDGVRSIPAGKSVKLVEVDHD